MPSCGIILFTIENDEIYFLLKKRRDSVSFVNLIKNAGKLSEYELNQSISLLTDEEVLRIKEHDFEDVWKDFNIHRKSKKEEDFAKRNFTLVKNALKYVKNSKKSAIMWGFAKEKRAEISRKKFKEHELNCALRAVKIGFGVFKDLKVLETRPVLDKNISPKYKYNTKYFLGYLPRRMNIEYKKRNDTIRPTYITPYTSEYRWVSFKESKHILSKNDIELIHQAYTSINSKAGKEFQYKDIEQLYKVIENYDSKNNKMSFHILEFLE